MQPIRDMSCEKESFLALTSGCPPWCKPQYERGEGERRKPGSTQQPRKLK